MFVLFILTSDLWSAVDGNSRFSFCSGRVTLGLGRQDAATRNTLFLASEQLEVLV